MIEELLKQMTLKEKIGQLAKLSPYFLIEELEKEAAGPIKELNLDTEKIFSIGSILGVRNAEEMIKIQERYLKRSRLKIPLLFMGDVIHGFKTIFPVPLAIASSFDPETARTIARVSAREANVSGLHLTFSPMADFVRDPRWGRVVESFGESKYLLGEFAKAMVEGYQEEQQGGERLGACVKHFACYGASEGGRDYNTVDVSRVWLHNYYLSGYREAVKAKTKAIMTAFTLFEGVPCTINRYLLRSVLREDWGFEGVTISDYDSLQETIKHGVSLNQEDAAKNGIAAGLDIEMASVCYLNHLEKLVKSGEVKIELIDEAVLRILKLKEDLGLFADPYRGASPKKEKEYLMHPDHLAKSEAVARDAIVLMKNNGVLPLRKNAKLALIGPFVTNRLTNGPWSWHGYNDENNSLADVFIKNNRQMTLAKSGSDLNDYTPEDLQALKAADIIILYLGEDRKLSGEAHSLTNISLPDGQVRLYQLARKLDKPTVVILQNGRPMVLEDILDCDAIMETWFLGSRSSEAIHQTLVGENNPSGKLPMSFPANIGQIPVYHDHLLTGRPVTDPENPGEYESRYLDQENNPRFKFAHGLSYSTFSVTDLRLDKDEMEKDDQIQLKVRITNHGPYPGKETILLFLTDHFARISLPVIELKQSQKIFLKTGETREVEFTITLDDTMYYLGDGSRVYDKGDFTVHVGTNMENLLNAKFRLI